MSLKIDRVELEIVIKNDDNRKQLRLLEDSMRNIRKEMSKLPKESEAWLKKKAELNQMLVQYDKIYDKIGLTGLSLKELKKRQAELNSIIGQIPGDSPLLTKYKKQADDVQNRLKQLKGQASETGLSLSKMANGINKYFGMLTVGIAGITGASMAFRKMAEDFAHMDDVESDVMKTTNLTKQEVLSLNEEFKKMDTRTSRESLNQLARDAGKLGIEGSKNILDFVEAGNQINVALGEDLGEDAIKNIGKMVGVFDKSTKELQGIGLKEQMLAVGSAINTLGASSSADESYLVDFAGRLGGVSKQAKISMDAILGFGSALDQDMQQTEMAATAFQNFILKLMGDPAKFAKLAGLEVKGFTKLLGTDANAAIKQVLRSMNEKGGFQALIPIFQDMGLDGSRAVGVLSSMAGSIDKIDEAQRIANKSLAEGTSATKEYNIKNTNMAAELDKAKKGFNETALELGSRLSPALLKSTHLLTYLTRGLVELPKWLKENKGLLWTLTVVMTAYAIAISRAKIALVEQIVVEKFKLFWTKANTAATLIHVAVTGYLTGATRAANLATKAFFTTLGLNPYVAIGVAIAAITIGIYKLATAKTIASKALKNYNEQVNTEILRSDQLFNALKNAKEGTQTRKDLIVKINEVYGKYLGYQLNEKDNLNKIAQAQQQVNSAMRSKIAIQVRDQAKADITEKYIKKQVSIIQSMTNAIAATEGSDVADVMVNRIKDMIQNAKSDEEGIRAAQQYMADKLGKDFTPGMEFYPSNLAKSFSAMKSDLDFIDKSYSALIVKTKDQSQIIDGPKEGDERLNKDGKTEVFKAGKWVLKKESGGKGSEDKVEVQRKKISDEMTTLDTTNLEKIKAIQDRYKKGEIKSEYDYNQELLAQQDAYDKLKISKLQELYDSISDPSLKKDLLNQEAEINKKNLDRQIEQNEKIKKIILDADPRKAEMQDYENRLRDTGLFGLNKESMTAEQLEAFEALEKQHNEKMRKLSSKDAALALDKQDTDQAKAEAVLAERRSKERMSDQQFKDEQLKLELEFLRKRLAIKGLSDDQIETITKQIQDKQNDIVLNGAENREAILQKYGIDTLKDQKEAELALIQYYEDQGVLTHSEALEVKKKLSDEHFRKVLDQTSEYFDAAASIADQASNVVNGLQDAELTSVETKYDKMIRAAKRNGQDTTQLEEDKESEQAKIRAKYADANFVITVAQIVAQTAKAAIDSYTSMAAIPVVGPVLGAAAAAAAVVYGAVQIKQANAAREAAKAGYKLGGYTDDDPDDDKEVGVVHANEHVTNAKGVRNPHVRKFLDVFDVAQKRGTIHMLNTSQILEQTKLSAGSRKSGGYGSDGIPVVGIDSGSGVSTEMAELFRRNTEMHERLMARLNVPLLAKSVISGDDGVARQLDKYNGMISNASR